MGKNEKVMHYSDCIICETLRELYNESAHPLLQVRGHYQEVELVR